MSSIDTLKEIIEVKELKYEKHVNEYLKKGWIIISTQVYDYGDHEVVQQKTEYCLGWLKSLGNPKHPKSKYSK